MSKKKTQKIDPRAYLAMGLTTSKDETRYYLAGIHLCGAKDGGTIMVSTDGHRLGQYHMADNEFVPREDGGDVILRFTPEVASAARKRIKDAPFEGLELTGSDLKIGKVTFHDMLIDATFPDWDKVVPEEPGERTSFPLGLNANYVGTYAKVAKELDRAPIIAIHAGKKLGDPTTIQINGCPEYRGVLMPCVIDEAWPVDFKPAEKAEEPNLEIVETEAPS